MKVSSICVLIILSILLVPPVMATRNTVQFHPSEGDYGGFPGHTRSPVGLMRGADTLQIAGSRLPDCSHACGSCYPCLLVRVSLKCAFLAESETCPLAYKCICNTKSFPVP